MTILFDCVCLQSISDTVEACLELYKEVSNCTASSLCCMYVAAGSPVSFLDLSESLTGCAVGSQILMC